jgi:hypothetical protein
LEILSNSFIYYHPVSDAAQSEESKASLNRVNQEMGKEINEQLGYLTMLLQLK